jgi:hypothetical protein
VAQNATHFFIAPQKRRVQPERYAQLISEYLGYYRTAASMPP